MRSFALTLLAGVLLAGVGCKHVAGICDCAHHPDNAVIQAPSNPYAAAGQPITGTTVPEKMAAPTGTPEKAPGK